MKSAVFLVSFFAGLCILAFSLVSLTTKRFQFWPPPNVKSWQYRTFWSLFRVLVLGVVVLCVIDFNGLETFNAWWRYFVGVALGIFGFSMAFYMTFFLGWKNAHGENEGLQTGGVYRWSRNPVYVVSILGFIGLGITINSGFVYSLLALWTVIYIIAPFVEEPWLEQQYGRAFTSYKSRVPRFVGFVRDKT